MTCGELLAKLLEAYGVEVIFGIPGVHTVELYRGLPQTSIRHVTPRHEQGAGFMADGYARASGNPGVCFVITGPGVTNIATAMGQAYADSIPMLVISSVNTTRHLAMGQGRLHELSSQRNLTAGVTAFSHTLLSAAALPEVMARAFALFSSTRPRPIHIEIPVDIITTTIDGCSTTPWATPSRPAPNLQLIKQAAELLSNASRPLIIAGGGAADASAEIRALAENLDAPVFMTINGKGILLPGHSLALSGNLAMVTAREELLLSDVVIAVGSELGETEMYPAVQPLEMLGKLIRIDIDPLQLANQIPADIAILSDATPAVAALNAAITPRPQNDGAARAAVFRERIKEALWPACFTHGRLLSVITRALPDAVIVGDSTEPVYAANQTYEAPRPRSYFNSSTGYGTLGYGLPAAIGAKLGQPTRPVVCLVGDGGLQFSLPELASAVEAEISIAVVLWNNGGYGEIKSYMRARNIPEIGVDIYTPDFIAIARGLGCHATRPTDIAALSAELSQSVERNVPTVIELQAGDGVANLLATRDPCPAYR